MYINFTAHAVQGESKSVINIYILSVSINIECVIWVISISKKIKVIIWYIVQKSFILALRSPARNISDSGKTDFMVNIFSFKITIQSSFSGE